MSKHSITKIPEEEKAKNGKLRSRTQRSSPEQFPDNLSTTNFQHGIGYPVQSFACPTNSLYSLNLLPAFSFPPQNLLGSAGPLSGSSLQVYLPFDKNRTLAPYSRFIIKDSFVSLSRPVGLRMSLDT